MQNKVLPVFLALIMVVSVVGTAVALGGGNARKGKFLYRKHCRSCHGQSACDLSPATLTQAEWDAKFEDVTKLPCYGDWPTTEDKDINDIFSYLRDYAKDSPSPAKCS